MTMACTCDSIGADPSVVTFCQACHIYRRGDRRLTSITRMLKSVWPLKPDFSSAPEGVIESARDRGVEVDQLFSSYLSGTLTAIPAGTRQDSAELLMKLIAWWEKQPMRKAEAQFILADEELAGCVDIMPPRIIYDLKTTYDLEPTYSLQVGGYCHLHEKQFGELPEECGIIHLTKRFAEPKLVRYEVMTAVSEFRVMLDFWRLVQRKAPKSLEAAERTA